jgi:hemerythrin-like domain-containing protein
MIATIELLSKQHQEVLAQLAEAETRLEAGDLSAFAAYLEGDVVLHFSIEEGALFPVMERYLSVDQGPLAVMHAEHASFRELLRHLGAGVRAADRNQQRICARDLIELLRAHIAKEDQVLFPMASRILTADEQGEVDARAAELGTTGSAKQP